MVVIRTEMLTKYYGRVKGIENLNLEVERGEVFGYLGPNGAGKTTTIRLLLGNLNPTRGRAFVLGYQVSPSNFAWKREVGYVPGELSLYGDLTGEELLRYFASLRGGVDWGYVRTLARRLDLDLSRPIRTYSHGNRQKLGIIQALMHKPSLLILDEPTLGLDPLIQQEFYRIVREIKEEGRTVFISSHILPEVEKICDRVGIIKEGTLVAVESIQTLKAKAMRRAEVIFAEEVSIEEFSNLPNVNNLHLEGKTLTCLLKGEPNAFIRALARHNIASLRIQDPTLEEIFLAFYS
ncbi:MAG: ABC transporter ATP-binding protein [Anaerolineae bacterium]|nr:ABC transporter ATP-binding protein [Anaerolineae bacterium]